MEKIKVLYLDDEADNLTAFTSSFRRVFDISIANSVIEAAEILKNTFIEVVIADQRMPDMTGVEFFESIIKQYPNPIRILLTGYSDINSVIDAINRGQIYRYINKPWNDIEIKLTIEDAYQLYQLREQNSKLQNKYQKVFNESTDTIMLLDSSWRLIDFNKAALELFNTEKPLFNFIHFPELFSNNYEKDYFLTEFNLKNEVRNMECKLNLNDHIKNCLLSVNVITNNYGNVLSYQAIIKDISLKKHLDQLLLKNTISAQENERKRIAQDLHDGLGQSLVGIKFHLEQLKSEVDNVKRKKIDNLLNIISKTINQLRSICYNILPSTLTDYSLKESIKTLCGNISQEKIKIDFFYESTIPTIEKDLKIVAFRIVQEFINNSIKHSECTTINISFTFHNNHLFINLSDNGKGFNIKTKQKGLGINNMISRVESYNGSIHFKFLEEKKGTRCIIDIPLTKNNLDEQDLQLSNTYVKYITTTTSLIGLRADNIVVIKQRNDWKETIELNHAIENISVLNNFLNENPLPLLNYLSDNHITKEAMEYYSINQPETKACAIIYNSFLQQKKAEMFLEVKKSIAPVKVFNKEKNAIEWLNNIK